MLLVHDLVLVERARLDVCDKVVARQRVGAVARQRRRTPSAAMARGVAVEAMMMILFLLLLIISSSRAVTDIPVVQRLPQEALDSALKVRLAPLTS